MVSRNDVIVWKAPSRTPALDGIFFTRQGDKTCFPHNDMERCEKMLGFATKNAEEHGGGILLITEGVFGMSGECG